MRALAAISLKMRHRSHPSSLPFSDSLALPGYHTAPGRPWKITLKLTNKFFHHPVRRKPFRKGRACRGSRKPTKPKPRSSFTGPTWRSASTTSCSGRCAPFFWSVLFWSNISERQPPTAGAQNFSRACFFYFVLFSKTGHALLFVFLIASASRAAALLCRSRTGPKCRPRCAR